jgi:hypothetical protein
MSKRTMNICAIIDLTSFSSDFDMKYKVAPLLRKYGVKLYNRENLTPIYEVHKYNCTLTEQINTIKAFILEIEDFMKEVKEAGDEQN